MTPGKEAEAAFLNHYLSFGAIIGAGVAIILVCILAYQIQNNKKSGIFSLIAQYALPLGFLISLGGSFLTLYYSEVLGYLPCGLCWFQRLFLYPMVPLFVLAWLKKDTSIFYYTKWFSVGGIIIALYHNYLQLGYNPLFPCPVTAVFADCAIPPFVEFGFVTFPFMSIVLFMFIFLLSHVAVRYKK